MSKRSFLGLETARDVDYAISKAVSTVELERDIDGNQRKELARKIQSDGIKIQKTVSTINEMESEMCNIDFEFQLEIEKMKISDAIENEIEQIIDILENCSYEKVPLLLDEDKLMTLCEIYSSKTNCARMKFEMKRISKCEIIQKYLTKSIVMIDIQITIPKISDLQVAQISSIPIFHGTKKMELELNGHEFLLYDQFSSHVTPDCTFIDSKSIFCESNRIFERTINSCISGLIWNETISNCHFKELTDDMQCYIKNVAGVGVLLSHSNNVSITQRRADDDSRRQTIRHAKTIPPGIQLIKSSKRFISQGSCGGVLFETGKFPNNFVVNSNF